MPNFKQLLDAAMKPLSTNANSPANSSITIDAGSASFVPPSDGFVRFRAQSTSSGTWVNVAQQQMFIESPSINNGSHVSVWLRVVKGVVVNFNGLNTTNVVKFFIPCLGGGYRLLLKIFQSGGAPCLRLKNSSTLGRRESALRNRKGVYLTDSLKEVQRKTNAQSRLLRLLTVLPKFPHGFATTLLSQTRRSLAKQALSATESFGAEAQTLRIAEPLFPVERVTALRCNSRFLLTTPGGSRGKSRSSPVSALPSLCANRMEVHYVA